MNPVVNTVFAGLIVTLIIAAVLPTTFEDDWLKVILPDVKLVASNPVSFIDEP